MTATHGPVAAMLPDGRRLHLQHGPSDLIVEAYGQPNEIALAYRQAMGAFQTVIADLMTDIHVLRCVPKPGSPPQGIIARNMWNAAITFSDERFITPMAAVAGAIADHIIENMVKDRNLERAYVNNGGDIALYLSDGQSFTTAVCSNPETDTHAGNSTIHSSDHVRGIATSGWRGRSHSLGIADSVSVLASNATVSDIAATLIANAVNLPGSDNIQKARASDLSPDSDLGGRMVTLDVAPLSDQDISGALDRGVKEAQALCASERIETAFLCLQGEHRVVSRDLATEQFTGATKYARPGILEAAHA